MTHPYDDYDTLLDHVFSEAAKDMKERMGEIVPLLVGNNTPADFTDKEEEMIDDILADLPNFLRLAADRIEGRTEKQILARQDLERAVSRPDFYGSGYDISIREAQVHARRLYSPDPEPVSARKSLLGEWSPEKPSR